MLAGNMADEIAMLVLDTDGAFSFRVYDLRDDTETGIVREEAAERRSVEAADRKGPLNEFEVFGISRPASK